MMLQPAVLFAAAYLVQPVATPQLNVEPSCRAASSVRLADSQSLAECMRDEAEAKKEVAKNWTSYSTAARSRCSAEVVIGGDPSYVELYECLDINKNLSRRSAGTAGK
jgi:hypothetical protein